MGVLSKIYRAEKYVGKVSALRYVLDAIGADEPKEDTGWRTTENGKHYHIGEGGYVDKGPNAMKGTNVNKPSTWKSGGNGGNAGASSYSPPGRTSRLKSVLEKAGQLILPDKPTESDWKQAEANAIKNGNTNQMYSQYLSEKALESGWYDQLKSGKIENLTPEETQFVLESLNKSSGTDLADKEIGLIWLEANEDEKKAYLSLMSKAMGGGYDQGIIDRLVHAAGTKLAVAKGAQPVGSSAEYVSKIHEIMDRHPNNKDYSRDELRLAGQLTFSEYQRRLKEFESSEEFVNAKSGQEKASDQYRDTMDRLKQEKKKLSALASGSPEYSEQEKLVKKLNREAGKQEKELKTAFERKRAVEAQKYAICLSGALSSVRSIGVDRAQLEKYAADGGPVTSKHRVFAEAINYLPKDWIENSMKQGTVSLSPLITFGTGRAIMAQRRAL